MKTASKWPRLDPYGTGTGSLVVRLSARIATKLRWAKEQVPMLINIFKSKIHRATVTESNPDYEGSVTVDAELMRAAGMLPYEQVHVWDVDSGARLTTYLLPGESGSGVVCMNGAAARLVPAGHKVILATFASMEERQARSYRPIVVLVDDKNSIVDTNHCERPMTACC